MNDLPYVINRLMVGYWTGSGWTESIHMAKKYTSRTEADTECLYQAEKLGVSWPSVAVCQLRRPVQGDE